MRKKRINEFQDKSIEITQSKQQRSQTKKKKKNDQSLRDLWDNKKRYNSHGTGVPNREEKELQDDKISEETFAEIFTNLAESKNTDSRIQVNLNQNESKQIHPRYIIIKLLKTKQRGKNLESNQKKEFTYRE